MYQEILNKIRQKNILHGIMLELTYQCNLNCFFCYNDKEAAGVPLEVEEYATLLTDLAAMQVMFVTLTGGEPLVHPHFFTIAGHARSQGFAIRIKSNGHLIHGSLARRLKEEVNPLEVEMSLHGATAEVHDRQTRLSGSFGQLIANIKEMKELELRPSLVSTLTAWNEKQLEEMFQLADSLGVRLRFQGPVGPRGGGAGKEDWQSVTIQPSPAGWDKLRKIGQQRREQSGEQQIIIGCESEDSREAEQDDSWCGAGSQEILVDPFGNVSPCLHIRWPAGNLHDQSVQDIWQQGKSFARARQLSMETHKKMAGKTPSQLGAPLFCPGLDLTIAGKKF
jgi:MoaA/NifB/PqqE/SkfB family radical SAM enzyme